MARTNTKDRLILSVIVMLFWFAQYVYVPCQTPYLTAQHVTSSMVGLIVGAYGVSQMLARLPVGIMADIANRHKWFILSGAVSSGAASLIRILSPAGGGFLVANLFSGFASAMWISFMAMYQSFYDREHQQEGTSRIVMYNNIGMMLGFVGSTLFYDRFGMWFLCLLSCLAGGIGAVLSVFLPGPAGEERSRPKVKLTSLLSVCKRKRLIFFAVLMLVQQGIQMSTVMSFTTQVMKDAGSTETFIGFVSVIYMLASVFMSMIAATKICTGPGGRFWVPAVFAMMIAYCVLVPLTHTMFLFVLLQIIPSASTGILVSFLISESMVGVPAEKKSTALGFFQAVYAIGMTGLPIVMGAVVDATSMAGGFYMLAAVAAAACIVSIVWYPRKQAE